MQISKKYVFCSPKSAGTTLVSLNLAIQNQFLEMDKKIAYLQLTSFPDAHIYANISNKRTILNIKNFLDEKERPANLLTKIAQNNGVDCFQSPPLKDWQALSDSSLINIINFLDREYDILYLDISLSLSTKVLKNIFNEAQKIIITSFFDPSSLAALECFIDEHKNLLPKIFLLFNQCPSESKSLIKKKTKNNEINLLGTLPIEKKYMWSQLFESQLLAFEKKSKWSQSLLKIAKKIINS